MPEIETDEIRFIPRGAEIHANNIMKSNLFSKNSAEDHLKERLNTLKRDIEGRLNTLQQDIEEKIEQLEQLQRQRSSRGLGFTKPGQQAIQQDRPATQQGTLVGNILYLALEPRVALCLHETE